MRKLYPGRVGPAKEIVINLFAEDLLVQKVNAKSVKHFLPGVDLI
jgi:hypothetical protein